MSSSPTGRRRVSSAPNLQQVPINSPEAKRAKEAFRRPPPDSKYTPHFLLWFLDLQNELGDPELDMADAWELYDERATPQDAAKCYRAGDGIFFWHEK